LINELVVSHARDTFQLPIAIFRLPGMFTSLQTGFLVATDPVVRFFQGFLQTGMSTRLMPLVTEDAGICCQLIKNISQNPQRKHTIYNTSRQTVRVMTEMSWMKAFGFNTKEVSYKEFRSASKARKEDSPLAGYWPLYDQFAPYWFENWKSNGQFPVETRAVEDDCHPLPPKPSALDIVRDSREWAMKNGDIWPFDLEHFTIRLNMETVLSGPRELCEKYNLDFNVCIPEFALEGLSRIMDGVDAPNRVMPKIVFDLTSKLESRIHLHHIYQMYPEIEAEVINAPIFILGLNRTGTTFLHRMLDASGAVSCPRIEENFILPTAENLSKSPSGGLEDERLKYVDSVFDEVFSKLQGIHDMGIGIAEEDLSAHSLAFHSIEYDVYYGLTQYREWLDTQSLQEVYAEHRRWLKFVSWWRKCKGDPPVQQWCLKLPWHARSLGALLKEYPDARIVHTHRAFQDVIASWCSLVEAQHRRFFDDVDREAIGRQQLESFALTLKRANSFRDKHPEVEQQWLDLDFEDIVGAPVETSQKVLVHAGLKLDSTSTERISNYVSDIAAERKSKTRHRYDSSDYGISLEAIPEIKIA